MKGKLGLWVAVAAAVAALVYWSKKSKTMRKSPIFGPPTNDTIPPELGQDEQVFQS